MYGNRNHRLYKDMLVAGKTGKSGKPSLILGRATYKRKHWEEDKRGK